MKERRVCFRAVYSKLFSELLLGLSGGVFVSSLGVSLLRIGDVSPGTKLRAYAVLRTVWLVSCIEVFGLCVEDETAGFTRSMLLVCLCLPLLQSRFKAWLSNLCTSVVPN